VKKRYYGKAEYKYPVYSLTIPKQYHDLLQPFLDEDLEANVEHKTNTLTITLKPIKSNIGWQFQLNDINVT
jgi:hypothetical protein